MLNYNQYYEIIISAKIAKYRKGSKCKEVVRVLAHSEPEDSTKRSGWEQNLSFFWFEAATICSSLLEPAKTKENNSNLVYYYFYRNCSVFFIFYTWAKTLQKIT